MKGKVSSPTLAQSQRRAPPSCENASAWLLQSPRRQHRLRRALSGPETGCARRLCRGHVKGVARDLRMANVQAFHNGKQICGTAGAQAVLYLFQKVKFRNAVQGNSLRNTVCQLMIVLIGNAQKTCTRNVNIFRRVIVLSYLHHKACPVTPRGHMRSMVTRCERCDILSQSVSCSSLGNAGLYLPDHATDRRWRYKREIANFPCTEHAIVAKLPPHRTPL
jgi:hypothetical protein